MKIRVKVDVEIRDGTESVVPCKECHIDLELETAHSECEALDETYFQVAKILRDSMHG